MFFISKRKFEERVWKEVNDLQQKEWNNRRHWELVERVCSLEIEIAKLKGETVATNAVVPKEL